MKNIDLNMKLTIHPIIKKYIFLPCLLIIAVFILILLSNELLYKFFPKGYQNFRENVYSINHKGECPCGWVNEDLGVDVDAGKCVRGLLNIEFRDDFKSQETLDLIINSGANLDNYQKTLILYPAHYFNYKEEYFCMGVKSNSNIDFSDNDWYTKMNEINWGSTSTNMNLLVVPESINDEDQLCQFEKDKQYTRKYFIHIDPKKIESNESNISIIHGKYKVDIVPRKSMFLVQNVKVPLGQELIVRNKIIASKPTFKISHVFSQNAFPMMPVGADPVNSCPFLDKDVW